MKKLILSLILFLIFSQCLHAQWTLTGNNISATNISNSVVVGASVPAVINASATLFPSVTPKMEIVTGSASTTYSELVTVRHSGIGVDPVSRQLGLIFKLSTEGTTEFNKMGGMVVESNSNYANNPTLSLVTANVRRLTIDYFGNIGIGTTIPDARLAVNGTVHANQVKVDLNVPGPDYVFDTNYKLTDLSELKAYVDKNHHLPEIPSANQMAKNGIDLGDMNIKLLKKVEELTLYLIEKDKQLADQQQINREQQKKNEQADTRIAVLEKVLAKLAQTTSR